MVIHTSYFWRTVKGKFAFTDMQDSESIQEYTALSVTPVKSLKHHSSVKSLQVDQKRGLLYTSDDKNSCIKVYCLNALTTLNTLKYSNCSISRLLMDRKQPRLFATANEGLLLFYDAAQNHELSLTFSMRVVLQPYKDKKDCIRQIEHDTLKNLLLLTMWNNDILVI